MSVIKRKRDNGQQFFEVRWLDNEKRKSRSFSRKIDAEQFERGIRRNKQLFRSGEFTHRTVEVAATEWLVHQSSNGISASHLERMKQMVKNEIVPQFGNLDVNSVRPQIVEKWIQALRAKLLAVNTVNKYILLLKTILNFEVRMSQMSFNPIGSFRLLRKPMKEFLVWEREDVSNFLELAKSKYWVRNHFAYVVYVLGFNTGLRAGEIWGLRWEDIRWSDNLIRVEQICERKRKLRIGTKSRRARLVPITLALRSVLLEWHQKTGNLKAGLVFSRNGEPINFHGFRRNYWFKDTVLAFNKLGLKRMRFHDIRHTAATLMLKSGLRAEELQHVLGHQSVTTTMRYVHLIANQSAEKAARIFSVGATNNGTELMSV